MEKIEFSKWKDEKRDDVSSVYLKRGNQELAISFLGNGDLYFTLNNFNDNNTFYIGKDNYEIYLIFDKLYKDIMNGDIFDNNFYNQRFREKAINSNLIDKDKIIWRSDDYSHDIAPYFSITKLDNSYKLNFEKPIPERELNYLESFFLDSRNCNVRLRNSGSCYDPYNIVFMRLFNTLMNLDEKVHQVHFEEYLVDKELEKGKSLKKIFD